MFSKLKNLRAEQFGGAGRALSHKNYRYYAMGHVAHVHGWWGNRLGIGWLTWELTGSATWLGIITVAAMVPVMIVSPITGAIGDRYGHRLTAMTAGLIGSVITGTMALLTLTGLINLEILVALTILQGIIFGLEFPARQALIPRLVGKPNIAAAVAFNATTFQLGAFIGPVLAAALISWFNAGAAIFLYSGTTLWMAVMLRLMDLAPRVKSEGGNDGSILNDLREGFRYVWGESSLLYLFLITITTGLFLRPYTDLLPGFAAQVFERGAEGLGTLNAASGLGALFVALWMMYRSGNQGLVAITLISAALTGTALIGFSLAPSFTWALPMLALTAGALLATQVAAYSLVQTKARADMRGRVIAINISINMGAPALGALFIGWLADRIGLPNAVIAASVVALVILALVIPLVLKRRKSMESISD
ncbi:MAG: MFS transporter [Rhodospirillales bacterium]|nr:MFS transporter [Rhodospirillales bacterium]